MIISISISIPINYAPALSLLLEICQLGLLCGFMEQQVLLAHTSSRNRMIIRRRATNPFAYNPHRTNMGTGFGPGVVVNFENDSDSLLNFELSDFERLGWGVDDRIVLTSGLGTRRFSSGAFSEIAGTPRRDGVFGNTFSLFPLKVPNSSNNISSSPRPCTTSTLTTCVVFVTTIPLNRSSEGDFSTPSTQPHARWNLRQRHRRRRYQRGLNRLSRTSTFPYPTPRSTPCH